MSGKYPVGSNHPEKPIVGVLSGWNKITTTKGDGTPLKGDHEFTIPDLLRLVKALRQEFSPERIAAVEELIERHVARLDNPHQDDLYKMNTSVLQELYLLWVEEGNQGKTREEFLKVLFQYVKIADIETTREGEAHDEVVTALGLKTVVTDHDLSLDAHDALLEYLFPGEPVCAYPTYSLDAYQGFPVDVTIHRKSPMTIITSTGLVKDIPADTLETDYSTGVPAWPIFGDTTNHLERSEELGHDGTWRPRYAYMERTPGIQTPRDYREDAWVLKEVGKPTPVCHELLYTRETFNVAEGKYYTISLFASPMGRDCLGIEVFDVVDAAGRFGYKNSNLLPFDQGTFASGTAVAESYRQIHYNMDRREVFISDTAVDLHGYIYPLYNGWYRIQFTFRALRSMPLNFRLYTLDIVDGDESHEGKNGLGVALFGLMATEGPWLPPYIPSFGLEKGHIAATSVIVPVSGEWYRYDCGSIVTKFNNNAIDCRLPGACEIYNFANGSNSVTHVARMPVGHNNRVYLAGYGANSVTAAAQYVNPSKERWLDIMHCYRYNSHLFGGAANDTWEIETMRKVNDDVVSIYLGCDRYERSQLNGFLRSLTYYPEYLKPGNMAFFTGRK